MLVLDLPIYEYFDEEAKKFRQIPACKVSLEHNLVAIHRWESHFCRPFLGSASLTNEELAYYIICMTGEGEVEANIFYRLSDRHYQQINDYIAAPMTATTFKEEKLGQAVETVTAELIYYWMISMNIPFECQYWHLNKLLTLVRVCSVKNAPAKKKSHGELAAERRALNDKRRAQFGTTG